MTHRFIDKNYVLYDFSDEFALTCPECAHKLTAHNDLQTYRSVLSCTHCSYRDSSDNTVIELSVKANCNNCGEKIIYNEKSSEEKDTVIIRCEKCSTVHKFNPKISQYSSFNLLTEKYPLWYSENFKGNHFWAYNDKHLQYIEDYVKAELRERNNRKYVTLVERLPKFIKSAKNREGLLKLIQKMKQKTIS